jgi:hypothetical protein
MVFRFPPFPSTIILSTKELAFGSNHIGSGNIRSEKREGAPPTGAFSFFRIVENPDYNFSLLILMP